MVIGLKISLNILPDANYIMAETVQAVDRRLDAGIREFLESLPVAIRQEFAMEYRRLPESPEDRENAKKALLGKYSIYALRK